MSKKSQEEKLRILQERLADISKKSQEDKKEENKLEEKKSDTSQDNLINQNEEVLKNNNVEKNQTSISFIKIIFLLILISSIGICGYYFSTNDFNIQSTINKIKTDFNNLIGDPSPEEEAEASEEEGAEEEGAEEEGAEKEELIYKSKNLGLDGFIIILNSYKKEDMPQAVEEVELLKEEISDAGILYMPKHTNSKDKIYQTYLGPFENMKEAKQIYNIVDELTDEDLYPNLSKCAKNIIENGETKELQ